MWFILGCEGSLNRLSIRAYWINRFIWKSRSWFRSSQSIYKCFFFFVFCIPRFELNSGIQVYTESHSVCEWFLWNSWSLIIRFRKEKSLMLINHNQQRIALFSNNFSQRNGVQEIRETFKWKRLDQIKTKDLQNKYEMRRWV